MKIHVRFIVIFLTNFPDNKIPWAPWMARAVHSHGPHMGCHCWDPWGLATSCHVGPACLPLLMSMSVTHRAPDSKIQWALWMANEGHSHGQHMGCQWCGPWGLVTSCHVGPTYFALLMAIWASMGPMYVCHHSANKINSMGPMRGLCVCLSKHPHHRWSQGSPQREWSGKAR